MRVYVASSWRNPLQPQVVQILRLAGFEAYDFRNPAPGDTGFSWAEIDPGWQTWDGAQFCDALEHPTAERGYANDKAGMDWADTCVLVLPCGRSAHAEAGFMAAEGKPVYVLLDDPLSAPDLMYKLFLDRGGKLCLDGRELVEALEHEARGPTVAE